MSEKKLTEAKFNYVYMITEISTGMKYIGSRGTNRESPLQDLIKYRSSSKNKDFKKRQMENPNDYKYEILSLHDTRLEALVEESQLHEYYDVKCNPYFYNNSNQTPNGFSTFGKVCVRDSDNNILLVNKDDPRYISGELKFHSQNKVQVVDTNGNNLLVDRNDPRYIYGELISVLKNKVTVKDRDGNIFQTSLDDPRYISGELVGHSKGRKTSEKLKKYMSEKYKGENNPFYGKKHDKTSITKMSNHYLIDDVLYIGTESVAKAFNIHAGTVINRCNSEKFANWKIVHTKYKNK